MKLQQILDTPVKMIDLKGVVCIDKSCPYEQRGHYVKCYLPDYFKECEIFLHQYKTNLVNKI